MIMLYFDSCFRVIGMLVVFSQEIYDVLVISREEFHIRVPLLVPFR